MPRVRASGAALCIASCIGIALAAAAPASAHLIFGSSSVSRLTGAAALVVHARVVAADVPLRLNDPPLRERLVEVEVVEVWKGAPLEGRLRFVQHGHGAAKYAAGEEVALFLIPIERSRLAGSAAAGRARWVSTQESNERYALDDASREVLRAAVRAYANVEELPPEERAKALRRATLALLASPDEALASSALRDVVLAADAPILTREDLPALQAVWQSAQAPIGVRVGLLAELGRRGLIETGPHWARLLREARGRDRRVVVRAVGAHPSPAVNHELLALVGSDDPQLAATAAVSLGVPGNAPAVDPLARLLQHPQSRLRMAAIRGLGGVATAEARDALSRAAAGHPDPATRRRAGAALEQLSHADRSVPAAPDPR